MKRDANHYRHKWSRGDHTRIKPRDELSGGFRCAHCRAFVAINSLMGTANRNHCNWCLWSRHVDERKGDRRAQCQAGMEPVGLTFKQEGYGRIGEIMLIHRCSACPKISINRIAGDDLVDQIWAVFEYSQSRGSSGHDIRQLTRVDEAELRVQLYGRR